MSVEAMMKKTFAKEAKRIITIIHPVAKTGQLNAVKKSDFGILKAVPCFFKTASAHEAAGDGGERQGFDAVAIVLIDEIQSIENSLDQFCRVLEGSVSALTDGLVKTSWLVTNVFPEDQIDSFKTIRIEMKRPEKGNQVKLP